ncbi:hypothetical protein BC833DRAFT_625618 [Globomyces pollinis-pini]|nr:hypothetical protein BC833DRAFT_625618 [Globomyces pollinis-pini]
MQPEGQIGDGIIKGNKEQDNLTGYQNSLNMNNLNGFGAYAHQTIPRVPALSQSQIQQLKLLQGRYSANTPNLPGNPSAMAMNQSSSMSQISDPALLSQAQLLQQQQSLQIMQLQKQLIQQANGSPATKGPLNPVQLQYLMIQQQQQQLIQQQQLQQNSLLQNYNLHKISPSTFLNTKAPLSSQLSSIQSNSQFSNPSLSRSAQAMPQRISIPNRINPTHLPQQKFMQSNMPVLPLNTYGPRLRMGHTSLVTVIVPETEKPKKSRFIEDDTDSEELYKTDESSGSVEESGISLRRGRSSVVEKTAVQPPAPPPKEIVTDMPPFSVNKKRRVLPSTKHEYEKIALSQNERFAVSKELLVPIRLEFDLNGYKVVDQFTWNLNEKLLTAEKFAEYLCFDLDLNPQIYQQSISRSIKTQIEEYRKFYRYFDVPTQQDTRITIRIDVSVGKVQLRDRFEWDLASTDSPEAVANGLCSDLSLGGEFSTLVAHSIREQIFKAKQSGDFESSFAIEKPFRSEEEARTWAPFVDCGEREDDDSVENTIEQDRKARLLRRQRLLGSKRKSTFSVEGFQPPIVGSNSAHMLSIPADQREKWRCDHCQCTGSKTSYISDGPNGPNTLCKICGLHYEYDEVLPEHRLDLFKSLN